MHDPEKLGFIFMKICGVYKVTNPIGEVYIGQSTDIKDRWACHRRMKNNYERLFKESLRKHGVENHIFEIIEECDKSQNKLRERFYQEEYFLRGVSMLNLVMAKIYGFPTRTHPTTHKLLADRTIKAHTGLKRSEESKLKMREYASDRRKPVLKYDQQGNLMSEYESAAEAARSHPLLHYSHIKGCCKGVSKTHGGFIWEYKPIV